MKLPNWIFPGLKNRLAQRRVATSDVPLLVLNLTRQTVLASRLEVADNSEKRRKGLLGRKGLSNGEGLWIQPCESIHTFGMQFSIDLIYLDRKHKIKKLLSSVPPWRISTCLAAHSVLELPSGTIRNTQTKAGDHLEFSTSSISKDGAEDSATYDPRPTEIRQ
jgi:uncharacterized membrane protein (UPF0127 family)